MPQKLQFVWPKDGPKGRSGHRGFFGRLDNILTNRGPDVFLQRKGSSTPILPDQWGNWDSYHDQNAHTSEVSGPYVSRGDKRYDPYSRTYQTWAIPHDWNGLNSEHGIYPRFTADEWSTMAGRLSRGHRINPAKMGEDWTHDGPKRFRQEHDDFWQNAHRIGENYRQWLHPYGPINPHFRMQQRWPSDLNDWMHDEGLDRVWRHGHGH